MKLSQFNANKIISMSLSLVLGLVACKSKEEKEKERKEKEQAESALKTAESEVAQAAQLHYDVARYEASITEAKALINAGKNKVAYDILTRIPGEIYAAWQAKAENNAAKYDAAISKVRELIKEEKYTEAKLELSGIHTDGLTVQRQIEAMNETSAIREVIEKALKNK